jgi:ATP-dependent Clp protease ATP-binding subunit ClpC
MYDNISNKVIGQDGAVKKIVKAIQRSRIGMKDISKPTFVGLCCGSSGVGKTELAKQIARYLFDSDDSLIRLDMSEYMEKISSTRITGSSAGYVGFEEGSAFLNKIRTKPYSVVLLDEIEKAHVDVLNLFLQMFDEGHMTDSHGRNISFKNCIILMTSNIGIRVLRDFGTGIGFGTSTKEDSKEDDNKSVLEKELKKKFAPEFINRIDEIIYFKDLDKEDIKKIVQLELDKSISRLSILGFSCEMDDLIIDKLVEVGYDPQFGARPLKRSIQKWVDDPITDILLDEPKPGSVLYISYDKDNDMTIINTKKIRGSKKKDSE